MYRCCVYLSSYQVARQYLQDKRKSTFFFQSQFLSLLPSFILDYLSLALHISPPSLWCYFFLISNLPLCTPQSHICLSEFSTHYKNVRTNLYDSLLFQVIVLDNSKGSQHSTSETMRKSIGFIGSIGCSTLASFQHFIQYKNHLTLGTLQCNKYDPISNYKALHPVTYLVTF